MAGFRLFPLHGLASSRVGDIRRAAAVWETTVCLSAGPPLGQYSQAGLKVVLT